MKENILFSLCFSGQPCRYHGRAVFSPAKISKYSKLYNLIFVCPELLGGLSVPRPAAYLRYKNNNSIKDINGKNLSKQFILGAKKTLQIAKKYNCKKAILCKNSPSCDRKGFTGELLIKNEIKVINL